MEKTRLDEMAELFSKGLRDAKKAGAAAAKLRYGQRESVSCEFENARLKTTSNHQSLNYSIEVLLNGKRGETRGNAVEDFSELVGRAVALAKAGSDSHFSAYPAPGTVKPVKRHSERTLALSRERLIEAANLVVEPLKARDSGLFIGAWAGRGESEGLLMTSGGVRHSWRDTSWRLGGTIQRTRDTDIFFAGYGRAWRDANEMFDPGLIADRILTDISRAEQNVDSPTGKAEVVLSPELSRLFLYPLLAGVNGRNVAKGSSPLRGRLEEKLLDSSLTIVDDPHVDFDLGAAEIDGDGVPAREFEIVKAGVLKGFLYDLDSAGLAGAEPTGHDNCSPHAMRILPGSRAKEDLLKSLKDGLYIKDLIGFGQTNIINGDIGGNVALGFRVRDGEIVGRVKDTMIAGNIYELLREGVELSREVDPVERAPYMKLAGLSVSAAKK